MFCGFVALENITLESEVIVIRIFGWGRTWVRSPNRWGY